ncbi:conserved hypothetical protein [Perkinsus marinus ATCC 50983]|uniref:18S rRNA (guanine(1575)-N(7))-methyltransferase Bud23 C-terminal domain-containing protein n=1 Tax=Perkinsus marinus (strain ATCC 50983 / TXsc) TaxID=423536 RepID=C5LTY9_PERM5|nr:conserved hypothetical protein [Perkinsus marinus ATCC 50983]EEQ99787.1 conserved hypothetical protein [Perkinsus marinus ATCC 50983]|eukprot:XP_002767070.1 conserved hypothetical protein [Perkinsus marinus ATCC 50983]
MGASSAMPNVALLGYWVLIVIVKRSISKGRWKWRIPPGRHGLYNGCITLMSKVTSRIGDYRNFSQVEMFTSAAMRSGFGSGGLVVDFPHSSKAENHFLVLYADSSNATVPQGLMGTADGKAMVEGDSAVRNAGRVSRNRGLRRRDRLHEGRTAVKARSWTQEEEERHRAQGRDVEHDSK